MKLKGYRTIIFGSIAAVFFVAQAASQFLPAHDVVTVGALLSVGTILLRLVTNTPVTMSTLPTGVEKSIEDIVASPEFEAAVKAITAKVEPPVVAS